MSNLKKLSWQDACDAELISPYVQSVLDGLEYGTVYVYEGDLNVDGDMESDWFSDAFADAEEDGCALVITGDLSVSGKILLFDSELLLVVNGKTRCQILEVGDTYTFMGDAKVDYYVYCEGNDATFEAGDVYTPFLFNDDHYSVCNVVDGFEVDLYHTRAHSDCDELAICADELSEAFIPELVTGDVPDEYEDQDEGEAEEGDEDEDEDDFEPAAQALDIDKLAELLAAGKPVLREDFLASRED